MLNKVCNDQGNVNFYMEVLKSVEGSKFATEVKTLIKIVVNVAINNSTSRWSSQSVESLQECIASCDIVIGEFTVSFNEEDYDATSLDIHVAGDSNKV